VPKTIFGGDHQHLVEVLTEARKAAGLTQVDLSQRIGRDQTFISLIERGQRRVDVIEFIRLTEAIGAEPVDLFARVLGRMRATAQHSD
jgi:transcriptional regulator with XRE-family HTH domain